MILTPKTTHVAYRCPQCGHVTRGLAGAFGLGAKNMLRLRCDCHAETAMGLTATQDERIRLSVPCLLCAHDHQYTVSRNLFYGKDVFHLACPYTDIDIGFFGQDEEGLSEAIDKSTEELTALYTELMGKGATVEEVPEEGDRAIPDGEEEPFIPDAQIYDIVRFVVKELEADGAISCPCGDGIYEVELGERGITVYCTECGASRVFATNSLMAAQDFLSCDRLELEFPKK
jgi:predicted RNA-binding Zn-ribbon protein involved in translation (DUF1610 family)